jgi:molecular chaperone DnaJ
VSLDEYYKRLELPGTASPADVKRAYRRLRAKYHPDRNRGREKTVEPVFKRIQEAFEILTGKRKAPVSSPAAAWTEDRDKEAPSREHRNGLPMRGANCLVELFVPLEAAIHGGEVEACYAVNGPCRQCQAELRSARAAMAAASRSLASAAMPARERGARWPVTDAQRASAQVSGPTGYQRP